MYLAKFQYLRITFGDLDFHPDVTPECTELNAVDFRKRSAELGAERKQEEESDPECGGGEELFLDIHYFKRIYLISDRLENFTLLSRLSITSFSPTRIGPNITLTVIDNGSILQICV